MNTISYDTLDLDFMIGKVEGFIGKTTQDSLQSYLKKNLPTRIKVTNSIKIEFYIPNNFLLKSINEAMQIIYETAHEDANIIFTNSIVNDMPEDDIAYSLLLSQATF